MSDVRFRILAPDGEAWRTHYLLNNGVSMRTVTQPVLRWIYAPSFDSGDIFLHTPDSLRVACLYENGDTPHLGLVEWYYRCETLPHDIALMIACWLALSTANQRAFDPPAKWPPTSGKEDEA